MKVSVCIPTYNQSAYIEQTIKSCVAQSFKPFEIIVSDDHSTDDTWEILEKLNNEIECLRIVRQPFNIGMVPNTDAVLRLANGDAILKLDSDDYLAPTFVEKLGKQLVNHSKAGYAHAAVQEIDGKGVFKKQRVLARKTGFYEADKALRDSVYGYQVAANIIMFRKSALEKVGFITAKTNFAEDYYLSAVLAGAGYGNVYVNEILSFYRVWEDKGNVRQRRKMAEIIALRQIFDEVLEPAFKIRGWNIKSLNLSRTKFACSHANCLGWKLFSTSERDELHVELEKLSSSPKARLVSQMYLRNWGVILDFHRKAIISSKTIIKTLYFFCLSKLRVFKS